MFKKYRQKKLELYVQQYFQSHPETRLVVVAGSTGKTSAKEAIATVLSQRLRVRMHEDDRLDPSQVPLAVLGISTPQDIGRAKDWRKIKKAAKLRLESPADTDVIIQELKTSQPGQMADFARYIRPDIAVITAVSPEYMASFTNVDVLAQEELTVANFSKIALINREDIDGRFANYLTNSAIDTYGTTAAAEYRFEIADFSLTNGYSGSVMAPEFPEPQPARINVAGEHSLRPAMAATAVAAKLGLSPVDIVSGLARLQSSPGRMNVLRGLQQSTIIDDTYDSNPASAASALQTLYVVEAPQRIAILGSMTGLGQFSPDEHRKIGELCDPNLLAWVVTIGDEAEAYLAPAARSRGCQVRSFKSPLDAGGFVHGILDNEGACILAKGSRDGVFVEEAVKVLVHSNEEDQQLVRQTPEWLEMKSNLFSKFS